VPTRRLRHGRAPVLLALSCCALTPALASAAYAPKLSVSVDPATPSQPSRIATTISQQATETANKDVVVSIPAGFAAPVAALGALPACTTQQISARACPESTRIGSAKATAAVLGLPIPLGGGVNWGGPTGDGRFVVIVFLDNATLNQHFALKGFISIRPDGGFDTTFNGLPNTTTTAFSLVFDGGAKAVLLTPNHCGDFPFQASFTSQNGERAQSSAPLSIGGCVTAGVPIQGLAASRSQVRFTLPAPANVRVLVKGPGDKVQLDKRVDAAAGKTTVKLKRALKKGRYRVAVTATGANGAIPLTRKLTLTVHR
jgi:hypothetical protein